VLAHYMPCFPAQAWVAGRGDWYGNDFSPKTGSRGGLSAKPILYTKDTTDPDLSGMVWDMRIAKQYGIDGFLIDELEDGDKGSGLNYRNTWRRLLKAAEIVGDFKIGLMPDYACIGAATSRPEARDKIKAWVDIGMQSPAFLRYEGKPVVFPYGVGFPDGRYKKLDNLLACVAEKRDLVDWFAAQGQPIAYAPEISVDWPAYKAPYDNDPQAGFQTYSFAVGQFTPTAGDKDMQRPLDYWPPSMMLMGENAFMYYNRGWCYGSGHTVTGNYRHRWDWNIAHRDRYRWIMLVTWNDWGETAIAPSNNHFMAWQPLTRYYADWFKTGREPKISADTIEIFHRPHTFDATPIADKFRIQDVPNFQMAKPMDTVEAVAFLKAPATIVIETGSKTYRKDVPAGLQAFEAPFEIGVQSARIERGGKSVASIASPVPVTDKPGRQDLWFVAADSAHPPRPVPAIDWSDVVGSWRVEKDKRIGTGLSVFGDGVALGYVSVSAKVRLPDNAPNATAGVVVHVSDDGANAIRLVATGAGQWRLEAVVGQTVAPLANDALPTNGPHTLRHDSVGEYLIAYIDGKLAKQVPYFCDAKDKTQRPYGKVGVYADGGSTEFSAISANSYTPEYQGN
jgi:hypothetical protein